MCPELAHLERVAGSRNRHRDVKGGRNQTLRKGGRDDKRHVNPTTLVPGMYRVIAPSPTGSLPPSSLYPLYFFFCRNRCLAVPPCDVPSTLPLCTQLRFNQRHSWLVRGECRRCDVASIDFERIGAFNFHAATLLNRINTVLLYWKLGFRN